MSGRLSRRRRQQLPEPSDVAFALLEEERPDELVARDTEILLSGGAVQHARDAAGRLHLLVPLGEDDPATEDTASRGVTMHTHELVDREVTHRYVDVLCEIPSLRDLFAVICDEMLVAIAANVDKPGLACKAVLERWRDLIGEPSNRLLSSQALSGLLAEIHVLETLATASPDRALRVWTGPAKGRADFTGPGVALETKATTVRERLTVEIHGLSQLDPPEKSELFLSVERMERVPVDGDSVPDAVARLHTLGMDAHGFMRALGDVGYRASDAEAYSKVRFRTLELHYYAVSGSFPRVTTQSFKDRAVLERITQLRYVLDLTATPPAPLSAAEVRRIMSTLASAGPNT
jgi:hypothetical protein